MNFRDKRHRHRFFEMWVRFGGRRPGFPAAIYLLASSDDLWSRTRRCVISNGGLDFSLTRIRGISVPQYTIYMAARDLYEETDNVSLFSLTSSDAISRIEINLIETAVMIRRDCLTTVRKLM